MSSKGRILLLVPTLCVGTQAPTLCVEYIPLGTLDAERPSLRYDAERRNEENCVTTRGIVTRNDNLYWPSSGREGGGTGGSFQSYSLW